MEIKDIYLTKCVNCCYKAVIDGVDDHGRICANGKDVYLRSDVRGLPVASWDDIERGFAGKEVKGFEIVPRDPGTYKEWQVGDKVRRETNDFYEVIFRSGELVVTKTAAETACSNYTCVELFKCGYRLVLTDIESQIIEEKKYEPQDGDICYAISVTGYNDVFICKTGDRKTEYYASAASDRGGAVMSDEDIEVLRPATEEEKQRLFDTMAKRGRRWNAEKKVVEDIPEPYEFKKGEPVLVRGYEFHRWIIAAYVDKDKLGFIANAGVSVIHWKYCLPYNERTMHLLGTTEDYKEE